VDSENQGERLLSGRAPEFDASAALGRFGERVVREGVAPRVRWTDTLIARMAMSRGSWMRPAAAAIAVVLVASAAAFTGVADTILTVFEPQKIATVQVDPSQLRGVPDPAEYGTLTWIAKPSWRSVADASAAAADAGFAPLAPASLPAGVPTQARWAVMSEAKATFQFDEAKARAAAARLSATIPPMPAAIAATTLTMSGGPAIMQQYGGAPNVPADKAAFGGNPPLIVVQGKAPLVTSNGATVQELRDYALAQPGIPPSVAAQIRAIGDPIRTLMVPIGIDLQDARAVTVRGTQGYLVGDQTGLGSGVFWIERGYAFAVFGSLKDGDLLALVNGLR
jgi:hypothetical protein